MGMLRSDKAAGAEWSALGHVLPKWPPHSLSSVGKVSPVALKVRTGNDVVAAMVDGDENWQVAMARLLAWR